MSTRSSARNLFSPLDNLELTIRRRSRVDPTLLNDFEMATEGNGDPPIPDLRTMEEFCQPTLNGRGRPIALISIQATNFRLKNDMIQQVQNSCVSLEKSNKECHRHRRPPENFSGELSDRNQKYFPSPELLDPPHHSPPRPSHASPLHSRHRYPSTSPPRHHGCNSRNHLHPAAATANSIPNINDHNHLNHRGSTLVPPSSTSPRPRRHSRPKKAFGFGFNANRMRLDVVNTTYGTFGFCNRFRKFKGCVWVSTEAPRGAFG
nr:reverse transcriptase domain-containing protein [Tanacetum cinerariifolium]